MEIAWPRLRNGASHFVGNSSTEGIVLRGSRRDNCWPEGEDAKADRKCSDVGKHPHRNQRDCLLLLDGNGRHGRSLRRSRYHVLAGVGARYVGANNLRFDRFGD